MLNVECSRGPVRIEVHRLSSACNCLSGILDRAEIEIHCLDSVLNYVFGVLDVGVGVCNCIIGVILLA